MLTWHNFTLVYLDMMPELRASQESLALRSTTDSALKAIATCTSTAVFGTAYTYALHFHR